MNKDRTWQELIAEEANELVEAIAKEGFESTHTMHEFLDLAMCIKLIPIDLLRAGYESHKRKCLLKGYSTSIQDRIMNIWRLGPNARLYKQFGGHPSHLVKGCLVLGSPGVGKTAMITKLNREFPYDIAFDLDNIVHLNNASEWVLEAEFFKHLLYCYPILMGCPANWRDLVPIAEPSVARITATDQQITENNEMRGTADLITKSLSMNRTLATSPYPETNYEELLDFANLIYYADFTETKFNSINDLNQEGIK